jgi:hypothetical protein
VKLRRFPSAAILAMTLLMWAAPVRQAAAQCLLCDAPAAGPQSGQTAARPLRLFIEADLDFSRIALTGNQASSGQVAIDPQSGARKMQGGVQDLGGMPVRGMVRVEGEPGRPIRIDLPSSVDLIGSRGGKARVTDLRTDLPPAPRIGADGKLSFAFGGALQIDSAISGEVRGRIPITVNYL